MKVYTLQDYTGCESVHLAVDFEAAIQAHLIHYGLLYLSGWIRAIAVQELKEVKDRSVVCWESSCCLAGASEYDK